MTIAVKDNGLHVVQKVVTWSIIQEIGLGVARTVVAEITTSVSVSEVTAATVIVVATTTSLLVEVRTIIVESAIIVSVFVIIEPAILLAAIHVIIVVISLIRVIVVLVTILHRTAVFVVSTILIIVAVLVLARLALFTFEGTSIQQISAFLIIIMSIIILLRASSHRLVLLLLLVHISIETFSLLISLHVITGITDIIGAERLGVGLKLPLAVFARLAVLLGGAAADVVKKSVLFIFLDVDGRLKFLELLV